MESTGERKKRKKKEKGAYSLSRAFNIENNENFKNVRSR